MNKLKSLSLLVAIATLAACGKKEETIIVEKTRHDKTVGESARDKYHAAKDRVGEAKDRAKEAIHNATK